MNTKRLLDLIDTCANLITNEENSAALDVLEEMTEVVDESIQEQDRMVDAMAREHGEDSLVVVSENAGDVVDTVARCEHGFQNSNDCPSCILEAATPG